MFSSLGLFKNVKCPQSECSLPTCLFNHDATNEEDRGIALSYDPESIGFDSSLRAKRRRLSISAPDAQIAIPSAISVNAAPSLDVGKGSNPSSKTEVPVLRDFQLLAEKSGKPLSSVDRPISPPPKKRKLQTGDRTLSTKTHPKQESLVPRTTTKDPVPFPQRMSILQKFHKQIVDKNAEIAKLGNSRAHLVLTEQEMINQALNDEQKAAQSSSSPDGYKNALAQRLSSFRKMTVELWEKFVMSEWRPTGNDTKGFQDQDTVITGLTEEQEISLVRLLKTPLDGLDTFGYVVEPPTASEVAKASTDLAAADGWEICERCGTRFQVFPGRNEDGLLTTRGSCTYHWARVQRRRGQIEAVHPCCSRAAGSEGCTVSDSHCFKVMDAKRLASLLQFERTPSTPGKIPKSPVAFDCEMAYTTYGLELIRLTAVSWPKKAKLLDLLVRPYGEILDLNTRFSGVSIEQYTNAPLLSSPIAPPMNNSMKDAELESEVLCKAESPAVARKLLFDLISPDTPLIGHAIDNDLNACRIVHPFVIDTVLLFPHPKGLPVRYKLKDLSSKYLQRQIQNGGEQGHDSLEDSSATGDLVLVKLAEKWKQMKVAGFTWAGDRIVSPSTA